MISQERLGEISERHGGQPYVKELVDTIYHLHNVVDRLTELMHRTLDLANRYDEALERIQNIANSARG